tara:strand:+ start:967 stop:1155 length:189 start_codon:yes stop_codon:yes gene_type:complete
LGTFIFIIKSAPFQPKEQSKSRLYLGVGVLSLCFLGIVGMLYYSYVENILTLEKDQLFISGI